MTGAKLQQENFRLAIVVNKEYRIERNQAWSAEPPGASLEKARDSVTNFASASRLDLVLRMTGIIRKACVITQHACGVSVHRRCGQRVKMWARVSPQKK